MELEIQELLRRIGIHQDHFGCALLAYAVQLALWEPDSLLCVTKKIYPQVAEAFHTKVSCVEQSLRAVIAQSWNTHQEVLQEIAAVPLPVRPTNSHMIALLCRYLLDQKRAVHP